MVSVISWGAGDTTETDKLDAMSVWIMGDGRDFAGHLLSRESRTFDRRYIAAIDAANPVAGIVERGRSLVAVLPGNLDASAAVTVEDFNVSFFETQLQMEDPRLFLLPLQADSVLTPEQQEELARIEELGGPVGSPSDGDSDGFGEPRSGRTPVVAIIDHGINFAHARFRDHRGQTRIRHAWDQGGELDEFQRVPFGRIFQDFEIDNAVRDGAGDETEVLKKLGLVDFERPGERPLAFARSHGTHVLDVAAGVDPEDAVNAPDIIAVNLPPVVAREPSGAFLSMFFIQGVEFILKQARSLSNPGPVILNFSFALSGGPRRGSHIIERSLKALIEHHNSRGGPPVTVVLPAGNRNIAGGHGVQTISTHDGLACFNWQLQPGDATSNMLELWISGPDPDVVFSDEITVHLAPPGGAEISATFSPSGVRVRRVKIGDDIIGRVSLRQRPEEGAMSLTIILAGTDPGYSGRTPAPPGPWTVAVSTACATGLTVEAWVMRDDTIPGFSDNGRQSYLLDDATPLRDHRGVRFADDDAGADGMRRAGTFNAIATIDGINLETVGAATGGQGLPEESAISSLYSATPLPGDSPLNSTERVGQSAVADRSPVRAGVMGAGTRSGSKVPMGGTSVAAPQVARSLAGGNVRVHDFGLAVEDQDRRMGGKLYGPPRSLPPEEHF